MSNATVIALPDNSLDGLLIWLGALVIVCIVLVPLYDYIRLKPKYYHVYHTRNQTTPETAFPITTTPFSWVKEVMMTPKDDIAQKVGLDAAQFLNFIQMCFQCIAGLLLIVFIMIPINFYASRGESPEFQNLTDTHVLQLTQKTLSLFSIENVKDGSQLLWFHLAFALLVSLWTYYVLYQGYKQFAKQSFAFHLSEESHSDEERLQSRTILIKNLTQELSTEESLRAWLDSLHLGTTTMISMNTKTEHRLWSKFKEHERTIRKIERGYMLWAARIYSFLRYGNASMAWWLRESDKIYLHSTTLDTDTLSKHRDKIEQLRPHKLVTQGNRVQNVDLIHMLSRQENDLLEEIVMIRTKGLSPLQFGFPETQSTTLKQLEKLRVSTVSAFVTFKSKRSCFMAQQMLLHPKSHAHRMTVSMAPPYSQVLWDSLSMSIFERMARQILGSIVALATALSWTIPTSFISSLTDLPKLSQNPLFTGYVQYLSVRPMLYTFVSAVGPPLIIQIANNSMPYFFDYVSYLQGFDSLIQMQEATLGKCFNFLLFNVQFVFILFSSAWSTSSSVMIDPVGWSQTISVSIPSASAFFMNFIILRTILLPLELLRPWAWLYFIAGRLFMKTPRELYELGVATSALNYGFIFPIQILMFCIILCYSIISPLILFPGLLYFGAAWIVYKNQLMYAYVKQMEAKGHLWLMAFHRSLVGIGVFQFTTAGLLSVKKAPVASTLCFMLLILTVAFYRFCDDRFHRHTHYIPLEHLKPEDPQDKKLKHRLSVSVVNSNAHTKHIQSVQELHKAESVTSYLSPAYSKPFFKVWLPDFVRDLNQSRHNLEEEHSGIIIRTEMVPLQSVAEQAEI
ncbi:hypothetical protein EDD86DRAFT_186350 [Gorgonomyces haynaldii]|nr:hypothetical protein EDD86DRAFT_186350 [Gorgonomyces haynaldii]